MRINKLLSIMAMPAAVMLFQGAQAAPLTAKMLLQGAQSAPLTAKPIVADPVIGLQDPLMGSKHDFTGLNKRAGVIAMGDVAYTDYGNPCVYCHVPPEEAETSTDSLGGIEGWNRFAPDSSQYDTFKSATLDGEIRAPNSISLLCLSCHDGTMALDMVLFKPVEFKSKADANLHMKLNGSGGFDSCGRCHNGGVAHDISAKVIGTDLRNDHPFSLQYGGLNWKDDAFKLPDGPQGFSNGVKLYNGNVECASCHNVHNPGNDLLLTARREVLCATCHVK